MTDIRKFALPVGTAAALVLLTVTATWSIVSVRENDLNKIYKRFESVATVQDLTRMETQMKDMTRALDDLRKELQSTRETMIAVAVKQNNGR